MSRSFKVEVHSKEFLSEKHFIIRLVPYTRTPRPQPGQFYLIRTSNSYDPFLRRPFSVFNWTEDYIEFFIFLKGKGTEQIMNASTGAVFEVIGPLGRGFSLPSKGLYPLLVGGGVGVAPLFYLANEIVGPKTIIYGGKTSGDLVLKKYLKGIKDAEINLVTEDGSEGQKGRVVDILKKVMVDLHSPVLYICGPGPMIEAIRSDEAFRHVEAYLSVEERMACGIGVCLGCAYPTKEGMKRVCIEGPVFRLSEL